MKKNVFANETNGNDVRRFSADGAALLGWNTVSLSKQCQNQKKKTGKKLLSSGGVVKS